MYINAAPVSASFDDEWMKHVEHEVLQSLNQPHIKEPPFSIEEMKKALDLPTKKILNAPGDDGIINILLINEMADTLLVLMNFITLKLVRPSIWGVSRLLFIPKKQAKHGSRRLTEYETYQSSMCSK